MSANLAITAFDSATGMGEPLRKYLFEISFKTPTIVAPKPGALALFTTLTDAKLNHHLKSVSAPELGGETLEIEWMGNKVRYDGKENSGGELTLSFWDEENLPIYGVFRNWRLLHRNIGGVATVGGKSEGKRGYALDLSINALKVDGAVAANWVVQNVSISKLPQVSFDSSSNDVVSFEVTLRYDRMILTP